ncbi:MAG: esterase [Anaerolineales bacterium]
MVTNWIQTINGRVPADELGLILPHEHFFTDLRGPHIPDYAKADPEAVVHVMLPHLKLAHKSGVTALVECSTVGVGRNLEIFEHLAASSPVRIIAPTGVYRESHIPDELKQINVEELSNIWNRELTEGIENSNIRAGFIKIAISDEGPTKLEIRNLKAAALTSLHTGAVIASHTPNGAIARNEIDLLEKEGLPLDRFIWVHANLEEDQSIHLEAARRGVYVEFDAIGWEWQSQQALVDYTIGLIEAGYVDKILLSHDAGWYDPSQPDGQPEGGRIHGYTALVEHFIPTLRSRGVSEGLIHTMTVENPARAFAFSQDGS